MMRIARFDDWTVHGRWGATRTFTAPAAAVVLHHSVTNPTGDTYADARTVEHIIYQRRIKARFAMVAYSYLIHPDGTVFEGRGVRYRNGANNRTKPGTLNNANTLSVCLIGTYTTDDATHRQEDALAGLLEYLHTARQIGNPRSIVPHSALHATACCGDGGRRLITKLTAPPTPQPSTRLESPTPPMDLIFDPDTGRLFAVYMRDGSTVAREYNTVTDERTAAARHVPGCSFVIDEQGL